MENRQDPPPTPTSTTITARRPPLDQQARRRQQCRVSQRRYRDKKGSREYNLKLDVINLRERVCRLTESRALLESQLWNSRMALHGAARRAVEQYYEVFLHGLHPDSRAYPTQVAFLQSFLDPDVQYGDGGQGIPMFIEQWRRYSEYHAAIDVQSTSAEVFGSEQQPVVQVRGVLKVRLTRETIVGMFPHVLGNEVLLQMLVGQEVEYATNTLYFFNELNLVVRQDLEVDFVAGLGKLLCDPLLTSTVVERALVTQHHAIGIRRSPSAPPLERHFELLFS